MKSIKQLILCTICLLSFHLKADNRVFDVDVRGQGSPILLFPGFTCTGEVWNELVNELSKTNECHVFTFAGFGDVPPIDTPWLAKIKEGVAQYIVTNNLKKSTIIGHSLGGTLGMWLATDEKAVFNKIIVVDALLSTGALMMPNFDSASIVYDNPYNQNVLNMDEEVFKLMATQMASGMSLNKAKHKQIIDWIITTDRKTYVYGYTDLLKLDLRESVSKVNVPVTILAATKPYGEDTVKKTYNDQYKNLKDYRINFASESAHFIMYDQPEWFLKQIKAALY